MYHEFAHFLVQDHSAAFHALMSLLMPEYRSVRAMLNGKGNN
jgi:predicted metal-dependent hydrolase